MASKGLGCVAGRGRGVWQAEAGMCGRSGVAHDNRLAELFQHGLLTHELHDGRLQRRNRSPQPVLQVSRRIRERASLCSTDVVDGSERAESRVTHDFGLVDDSRWKALDGALRCWCDEHADGDIGDSSKLRTRQGRGRRHTSCTATGERQPKLRGGAHG